MGWKSATQTEFVTEDRSRNFLPDGHCVTLRNVVKRTDGALQTRPGKNVEAELGLTTAQSMLRCQRTTGVEALMVQCSDKIMVYDYDGLAAPSLKLQYNMALVDTCHMLYWQGTMLFTNSVINLNQMKFDATPSNLPAVSGVGRLYFSCTAASATLTCQISTYSQAGSFLSGDYQYIIWKETSTADEFRRFRLQKYNTKTFETVTHLDTITFTEVFGSSTTTMVENTTFFDDTYFLTLGEGYGYFDKDEIINNGQLVVTHLYADTTTLGYTHTFGELILALVADTDPAILQIITQNHTYELTCPDIATNGSWSLAEVAPVQPPGYEVPLEIKYNGSDNIIPATCMAIYGERLYVGYEDKVSCSELGDLTLFYEENLISVAGGDGDYITALTPLAGGLIIFKRHSTWVLYGDSFLDWQLSRAPIALVGAVNPWSVVSDGNKYLFIGHDNLYQGTLNSVSPVSITHMDVVKSMTEAQRLASFAVLLPFDLNRAIVQCGGQVALNIEVLLSGITSWDNLSALCGCSNSLKDDDGWLLTIGTDGALYKWNGLSDDGTAIVTMIIPGVFRGEVPFQDKVFRRFIPSYASITNTTAELSAYADVDSKIIDLFDSPEDYFTACKLLPDYLTSAMTTNKYANVHGQLELHTARGKNIAFILRSEQNIVYNGHTILFSEVGSL